MALKDLHPITFQAGADKTPAQLEAVRVIGGQKAVGETTPQPQTVPGLPVIFYFQQMQRGHVDIFDPSGQALAGLAQKIDGGGTQDQEAAGAFAAAAPLIDQAAQGLEKLRRPVDFIENNQLVLMELQEKLRLPQPVPVGSRSFT